VAEVLAFAEEEAEPPITELSAITQGATEEEAEPPITERSSEFFLRVPWEEFPPTLPGWEKPPSKLAALDVIAVEETERAEAVSPDLLPPLEALLLRAGLTFGSGPTPSSSASAEVRGATDVGSAPFGSGTLFRPEGITAAEATREEPLAPPSAPGAVANLPVSMCSWRLASLLATGVAIMSRNSSSFCWRT